MESLQLLKSEFIDQWNAIISKVPSILVGLIVIVILYFIMTKIRSSLVNLLTEKSDDKILVDFANSFIKITTILLLFLFFMYVIGFGNIAGSILGAAGISAFIIGFALKDIGENFLAGLMMAFDRPFRLGDTIKTGSVEGVIMRLGLRDTHVKTFDGKDVFVPNGQILKTPLYNYTIDGFLRKSFSIGIDYESDIELARKVILDTVKTIPGVLNEGKAARTHISNLNASTIDIECHFWINTFDSSHSSLEIRSLAQSKSIIALSKSSIKMPADIVEIKNYGSS